MIHKNISNLAKQKRNGGRFETITSTKIRTENGTILKSTEYLDGGYERISYKIKPTCSICGKKTYCFCYNEDTTVNPEQDAIDGLKRQWVCDNNSCILAYLKDNDPKRYQNAYQSCGGDETAMIELLESNIPEMSDGEGDFC